MTKAQKNLIKRIDEMYRRLSRVLARDNHESRYLDTCEAEERQHRRGDFRQYHPGAAPVMVCARHFYVRNVLRCALPGESRPQMKDFWSLKHSYMGGYALYIAHEAEIRAAFTETEMRDYVETIEYTELVSPLLPPV